MISRAFVAIFGFGLVLAVLLGGSRVDAHPHVWAKIKSVVLWEKGQVVGLRHEWLFDKNFAASIRDEFDTDKNGHLSRAELSKLVKLNMVALKDFGFFTEAKLGKEKLVLQDPFDFDMAQVGKEILLRFSVRFKTPRKPMARLMFTVEDPTYFTSLNFEKAGGVQIGKGAPEGCGVTLQKKPPRTEQEQRLFNAFASQLGDINGPLGNPMMAVVSCAGKS